MGEPAHMRRDNVPRRGTLASLDAEVDGPAMRAHGVWRRYK